MNEIMNMEHWWNDGERGKLMYLEKNESQSHFVHKVYHQVV
jgi:hypothetical protein